MFWSCSHCKTYAHKFYEAISLFPDPLVFECTSLANLSRLGPYAFLQLLRSHGRSITLMRQRLPYPSFVRALHGYLGTLRREDMRDRLMSSVRDHLCFSSIHYILYNTREQEAYISARQGVQCAEDDDLRVMTGSRFGVAWQDKCSRILDRTELVQGVQDKLLDCFCHILQAKMVGPIRDFI